MLACWRDSTDPVQLFRYRSTDRPTPNSQPPATPSAASYWLRAVMSVAVRASDLYARLARRAAFAHLLNNVYAFSTSITVGAFGLWVLMALERHPTCQRSPLQTIHILIDALKHLAEAGIRVKRRACLIDQAFVHGIFSSLETVFVERVRCPNLSREMGVGRKTSPIRIKSLAR